MTLNSAEETKGPSCLTRTPGSSLASRSHEPMAYWTAEGKLHWESLRNWYSVPDASQWPREQTVVRILFNPKDRHRQLPEVSDLNPPPLCILISTRLEQDYLEEEKLIRCMLDDPAKSRARPAYNDINALQIQVTELKSEGHELGWGSLKGLRWWVCLDKMR